MIKVTTCLSWASSAWRCRACSMIQGVSVAICQILLNLWLKWNRLCIVCLKHFRSRLDVSQTRCYLIHLLSFRTLSSHTPCLIQKLYPKQKLLLQAAFFFLELFFSGSLLWRRVHWRHGTIFPSLLVGRTTGWGREGPVGRGRGENKNHQSFITLPLFVTGSDEMRALWLDCNAKSLCVCVHCCESPYSQFSWLEGCFIHPSLFIACFV